MIRFKITTGKKWEYDYNGHKIVVTNVPDRCELIIDDKVQDVDNGIGFSCTLTGVVDGKKVKVSVGGMFVMKCDVFVDHEQLVLVNKSEF